MKKELKVVDEKRGIIQITLVDERWYAFTQQNKATGLPEYMFVPSVTWICEYYPKGIAFYKWLANKGWDEAEAIKVAAGDKGSKVHYAIGDLLEGKAVNMTSQFLNPTTEKIEELTVEEYEAVLSFATWFRETKPKIISREFVVVNQQENYAGTVDFLCEIYGLLYLVDFKTSQYIWPSHELQISAYSHAPILFIKEEDKAKLKLAVLQIGYKRNKNHYKFTEIEDKYNQFLAAKIIWANETKDVKPLQRDYPLSIELQIKQETEKETKNERQPDNSSRGPTKSNRISRTGKKI